MFDRIWAEHPHTTLTACGESVGLPAGQMGNSEVGHLNLGAGAIVPQDLARIDEAVEDGTLGDSEVLRGADGGAERVHLIGLVSDGGVHSSDRHLKALIELAAAQGRARRRRARVHRRPRHLAQGRREVPRRGRGAATARAWARVIGRYFAMDRDERWDRIQKAYDLLVHGKGEHHADSAEQAAKDAYERDETDEFITATTVGEEARASARATRCWASTSGPTACARSRARWPRTASTRSTAAARRLVERYATLAEYDEDWDYPVVFPPERPDVTLAQVIADRGLKQLHVAETEKYPHVTYFFNGGEEDEHEGETFKLVPSPRDVPTYDHKPEMSAYEATDAFVERFEADEPAFAIINFANADMVGHTGVIEAAVKAVEAVDECLGRVLETVHAAGGACIVTADHGNADEMLEEDGSPDTAHSLNPVPFVVTAGADALDGEGILADVAPTALALLGIEQPAEMTGRSLLAA